MQQQQVTFHWIHGKADGNGLDQHVICRWQSSDCAGSPVSVTGRFAVSAPDIGVALCPGFQFGTVNITDNVSSRIFGLWKGNSHTSGYSDMFNFFTLNGQGYDGKYAQVIDVSIQESETLLYKQTWIISATLDSDFGSYIWDDTPGCSLGRLLLRSDRHDHFSTYILCKPLDRPDAIGVPALRHEWYWHGTATQSSGVFLLSRSGMDELRYFGHGTDGFHLELPEWNGYHVE